MKSISEVRQILASALQLGERAASLGPDSKLLGALPELDSVSVVNIVTAIEERYGVVVEDDEIHASIFDSVGSLALFIDSKTSGV